MSIELLQSLSGKVKLPDGNTLDVKGLTLNNIALLTKRNKDTLSYIFDQYNNDSESDLVQVVLTKFPDLAAEICCLAIGAELNQRNLHTLRNETSFPIQLDILSTCGRLTFGTEDSLKKCVEAVLAAIHSATKQLETITVTKAS